MVSEPTKKVLILCTLGLLMVSAFFVRLESFRNSIKRSTDEVVYYSLAHQFNQDPFNYTTIPYARMLRARGQATPKYFKAPLYKYPPFFTMMTATSVKFFGEKKGEVVYYVPLMAGVLLIPIIYLLGAHIFNRITGLLAAILLFIDPIAIGTSQKIWIESSLVLFSIIALFIFIKALASKNKLMFVLSGISVGLATNVKYPGILLIGIFILYAWFYNRPLFKNRGFLFCLIIPIIMLTPWLAWNMQVYGASFFREHLATHIGIDHINSIRSTLAIFAVVFSFFLLLRILQWSNIKRIWADHFDDSYRKRLRIVCTIAFCIMLISHIIKALNYYYIPTNSWRYKMFLNEAPTFYLGRLIEFSLIYLLGFLALFKKEKIINEGRTLVKITILFYLFFYSMWGNFQSRYILLCSSLLILLGVYFFFHLLNQAFRMQSSLKKGGALLGLIALIGFIVLRTTYINQAFTYINDFCYF